MSDEALVFSAKDGLGNRLRALAGLLALAEIRGVPLLVHWGRDGACDADFLDLFDSLGWGGARLIDAAEAAVRQAEAPELYHHTSVWFTEIWKKHSQADCPDRDFNRLAVARLRAIRPRPELLERVDDFAIRHHLTECVGVHIRMTDNVHAYDWWLKNDPDFVPDKVSQLEGFRTSIREITAQGKRALLCTDNQVIVQQFRTDFPNLALYQKEFNEAGFAHHVRTHYSSRGTLTRFMGRIKSKLGIGAPSTWRTTDVGDAFVEMLLLARCQRIIGTYYSSFSQVAALIGGIRLDRLEGVDAVENEFIRGLLADAESIDQN